MILAKVILPSEMTEYFDLVKVRTDEYAQEQRLHLYLDEKDITPEGHSGLTPNGFYEESCMNDFPIREYRTVLHVRRRRWKDADGKSVSKDWQMIAKGTRYSKEFATFLKGDEFERAYKDHLSDFRTWKHREHAQKWLVFPKNIGPNLSIDETALSNGDLYTIISNKDAHGRKGALVAIVSGTRVEDVVAALMKIHWYLRSKVREVTMDFSEGMHQIVLQCFPYADITLDRFHMQQLVSDAMQELRLKHKKEAQKAQNDQRKQFKATRKKCLKVRKKDKKSKRGRKPFRKNMAFVPERLSNGDTVPELLGRCRYSLMVSGEKWTATQKERVKLVFERYPDLEEAYSIVHSLRMIFSNPRATWISGYESIQKWYEKVKAFGNDSFNTAADTIKDREDEVLNYFLNRATNASAESLNSKIKQFRAQLRGVIDVDFFLYRLSMIYG